MAVLVMSSLRYPGQVNPQLASADAVAVPYDTSSILVPSLKNASANGLGGSQFLYREAGQTYRCRVLTAKATILTALAASTI
jgi:hypothetical protein